jgi:hypothetical protein
VSDLDEKRNATVWFSQSPGRQSRFDGTSFWNDSAFVLETYDGRATLAGHDDDDDDDGGADDCCGRGECELYRVMRAVYRHV